MTVDKLSIFDGDKKPGQRELPRVELTKELLDSVRHIEGFPIGSDEDIIRLSDPPYYTACPNPFIGEFIKKYGKPYDPETDNYHREPFAADVSEGKNDPIYNAHSYHTKVPHKAIMRYILHYTEPGDIVFDGFCGTGMTGVAAQLCGSKDIIESLGYKVTKDGSILERSTVTNGTWAPFSRIGPRRVVLNDLSPAAGLISHNYNIPIASHHFSIEAQAILRAVDSDWGWMYATLKPEFSHMANTLALGLQQSSSLEDMKRIVANRQHMFAETNYTIWSDIFICPDCATPVTFFLSAVDRVHQSVREEFPCHKCGSLLTKRNAEKAWSTHLGSDGGTVRQPSQKAVLINYSAPGIKGDKEPDAFDFALLEKIEGMTPSKMCPQELMMFRGSAWGDTWRAGYHAGVTQVDHFFAKRTLIYLCAFYEKCLSSEYRGNMLGVLRSSMSYLTKLVKVNIPRLLNGGGLFAFGAVTGTLYIPSIRAERRVHSALESKIKAASKTAAVPVKDHSFISTQSLTDIPNLPSESCDYIFVDPPFGGNLMYSELNFLAESWLKVYTNASHEAIESEAQEKRGIEYLILMKRCFAECFRVLKPGRWMTVEFHNSENRIWNALQEALVSSGFVLADARTLDKKQESFKQATSAGAVKQDLVLSVYKPSRDLENELRTTGGTPEGVWAFVRAHLSQLPTVVRAGDKLIPVDERKPYLLYDRMIAFHIKRLLTIPYSAPEFYEGLKQRFSSRDGMYFLPEQAAEYDKARAQVLTVEQLSFFFIDEKTAILWVRNELEQARQTFGELQPKFMKSGQPQRHELMPDLQRILEQNFLKDHEERWYVPDPNRQADLEKMREKELLREFEEYLNTKGKIKVFRTEAVRAGFKQAWAARDFATIVSVAKKLPEAVLQEDSALLMYYDNARTRLED